MLKGNKYRIYPTAEQEIKLAQHFGCVRSVFNMGLEIRKAAYNSLQKSISGLSISNELKLLKKEFPYFKEVNSQSLQAAFTNLDDAFNRFFKQNGGFPKFKKKSGKQSFTAPQNGFLEEGKLSIPKFREGIEIVVHRKLKGIIKGITISRNPSGKYFASILTDTGNVLPIKAPVTENKSIGIDLGLKNFIILSDGKKYDNPRYLRESLEKLAWLQRSLKFKKNLKSNRRKKLQTRIARLHEHIANLRKDFLHKLSSELVNNHDTLCFETLKVANMVKNHCLALSISDAGWSMFLNFCKYKAEWRGKNIIQLDTFEASSKECNCCGHHNKDLTLDVREWTCPACNALLDRDINAALVIKYKCLRLAGRQCQDAEVSPLCRPKRRRKRADEALKVQNDLLDFPSN